MIFSILYRNCVFLILGISCFIGVGTSEAQTPDVTQQPQAIVVLRNGEVLSGQIDYQQDRVILRIPSGEIRLRLQEIEFVCDSVEEAYSQKKAAILQPRSDDHIELAYWCIRNGLKEQARNELDLATAIYPNHPKLGLIKSLLDPPQVSTAGLPETDPRLHAVSGDELQQMMNELPPRALSIFSSSIQPLLMNSCAISGCHASKDDSDYALIRVGGRGLANTHPTRLNLHATLKQIDRTTVFQSSFYQKALQAHGNQKRAAIRPDSKAHQSLANWLALFAPSPEVAIGGLPTNADPLQDGNLNQQLLISQENSFPPANDLQLSSESPMRPPHSDSYQPRDAFDPELFNRRYHSRTPEAIDTEENTLEASEAATE